MKILILRFSSIGDIVLTTPVIRGLKTQLDQVEIHFATKTHYRSIAEVNPYIDKVHVLDGKLNTLIKSLRSENFDWVIDLHHNLRTLIIKTSLAVPSKSFRKLNFQKWLLVNFKINKLPNLHIVDRYLETVKHLGVKPDALGLDFFIDDKDFVPAEWLPETHRKEFVAYAIGAQHHTKKLPITKMVELCDKINKPIILLGGKEDHSTGEQLKKFFDRSDDSEFEDGLKELNKKTIIYNACGLYTLGQSASILKRARVVFTHDTGLMHIAAALKKEVFSIWGNTVPAFGMYPYRTRFTILENANLNCRPCSKIGHSSCPKMHFKCMKDINLDFYLPA